MKLDEMLDALEKQLGVVAQALGSLDVTDLEQASGQMREAMLAFSELARRFPALEWTPFQRRRSQVFGLQLTQLREQLTRLTVQTQRQAEVLVPQVKSREATYGQGVYGQPHTGQGRAHIYQGAG
ncbi:hypothetical protein [Comamonas composti]|uniref:hypothetical protein n=1 Tax=Comamonas composti TaxID=408558 RepID=UPI00041823CC|nr:hypothetical protein [Comamonas composti]